MTLLIVTFQSHFLIASVLEGVLWFLLPVFLVTINDIFAYVGGMLLGRTRLIKVSPKKTWEGFISAFICTMLFAAIVSNYPSPLYS